MLYDNNIMIKIIKSSKIDTCKSHDFIFSFSSIAFSIALDVIVAFPFITVSWIAFVSLLS